MASGVTVCEAVMTAVGKMKVLSHGADQNERTRLMVLKIKDGQVVVDKSILEKELHGCSAFRKLKELCDTCCYVLYDCHYETKETRKEDMVAIMCTPDNGPIKDKLYYAASRRSLESVTKGFKYNIDIHDPCDIADIEAFAEKLGLDVVTLEGEDCHCHHQQQQQLQQCQQSFK